MIWRISILSFLSLLTLAAFVVAVDGAVVLLILTALVGAVLMPPKYLKVAFFLVAAISTCATIIYHSLQLALKLAEIQTTTAIDGTLIVLSLATSMGIVTLVVLLQLYIASEGILGLSQYLNVTRPEAMRIVLALTTGLQIPYQIIENGKVEVASKGNRMSTLGGLGILIIRPAMAAVLEWGGTTSAVVGPGVHRLRQFEKVAAVMDLRPKSNKLLNIAVQTSEGIPLRITIEYTYRIEDDDLSSSKGALGLIRTAAIFTGNLTGMTKYKCDPVGRAAYMTPGESWQTATENAVIMAAHVVFGAHTVEDVYGARAAVTPGASRGLRATLSTELRAEAWRQTTHWGVAIETIAIEEIPAPESVVNKSLSLWEVTSAASRLGRMGEAEARTLTEIETARYESSRRYLKMLNETMEYAKTLPRDIGALYVNLIENITHEVTGDRTSAYRYLQILETMSKHPNANVTINAGENDIVIDAPASTSRHR